MAIQSVTIDDHRCTGSGNCALVVPEVFELDEMANRARVLIGCPSAELESWVLQAARQCPSDAIVVRCGESA